jgi:hypothetical protein
MANLKLEYGFTSNPYPILISGTEDRHIDLVVTISQPGLAVPVQSILIEIPVGANADHALSADRLPDPHYDKSQKWEITIPKDNGSLVSIKPPKGTKSIDVVSAIEFTIPGIKVNNVKGFVAITITEFSPTAIIDAYTYRLEKLEADFPIRNFYAADPVLHDLDRTTTLYWECTDQGKTGFSYRGRTADASADQGYGWMPKECLTSGICYSCADGPGGVQTPQLAADTTFALDVIKANALGHLEIHKTLFVTVRVEVPSFSHAARLFRLLGEYAVLHWRAFNASRVTVMLNDDVIERNAPADTYLDGYRVALDSDAPRGSFHLTAHARSGKAVAYYASFPGVTIRKPLQLREMPFRPTYVALAANKNVALVAAEDGQWRVIDLDQRTVPYIGNFDSVGGTRGVAITPNGKTVVFGGAPIQAWDVATRTQLWHLGGQSPGVQHFSDSLLMTSDGRFLLTTLNSTVGVVDMANPDGEVGQIQTGYQDRVNQHFMTLAATPDGSTAIVATFEVSEILILDIARRSIAARISIPDYSVTQLAIAPDGKLALATVYDFTNQWKLMFIDIASHTITDVISMGAPVLSPAGRVAIGDSYAFVTAGWNENIAINVIDLSQKKIITTLDGGQRPSALAVRQDNSSLVVLNDGGVLII